MSIIDYFRLKWKIGDPKVRYQAVFGLTNQKLRAKVAEFDPDPSVRGAAIVGLEDQIVLARIAGNDPELQNRGNAARRIEWGAPVLADLFRREKEAWVLERIIDRMDDPEALAKLACNGAGQQLRKHAFHQLVAVSAHSVRVAQSQWEAIAMRAADSEIALVAVQKIHDEAMLRRVSTDAVRGAIRDAARRRLPDRPQRQTGNDILHEVVGAIVEELGWGSEVAFEGKILQFAGADLIAKLVNVLDNSTEDLVLRIAVRTLQRIGDARVIAPLEALVQREGLPTGHDPRNYSSESLQIHRRVAAEARNALKSVTARRVESEGEKANAATE